ncbi:hypothetical protein FGB62_184g05 [Gracilaria domingensis]|nr:hypothetical protein FGB62_184g05 [Gracilaria domingensis]
MISGTRLQSRVGSRIEHFSLEVFLADNMGLSTTQTIRLRAAVLDRWTKTRTFSIPERTTIQSIIRNGTGYGIVPFGYEQIPNALKSETRRKMLRRAMTLRQNHGGVWIEGSDINENDANGSEQPQNAFIVFTKPYEKLVQCIAIIAHRLLKDAISSPCDRNKKFEKDLMLRLLEETTNLKTPNDAAIVVGVVVLCVQNGNCADLNDGLVLCAPSQNTILTFAGNSNKEPKSTLNENPSSFHSNSFSTEKLSTERSEGKKEEETIGKPRARNDLSQRRNDPVPLSTSSNRTSSNRTRTASSSTFGSEGRTVVNRPALQHDSEAEYRVPTCILDDFDADTHCISFLYASFNLLQRIEHSDNYQYQAPSANGLSLEDATEQYQNSIDNVFTDGFSLSSCVRRKVSYNRSSVLPKTPGVSLKLVVDIDPIDFVTIPWGGSAFRTACKIFLRFETRHQEPEIYLTPNNNLAHFPSKKLRMRAERKILSQSPCEKV